MEIGSLGCFFFRHPATVRLRYQIPFISSKVTLYTLKPLRTICSEQKKAEFEAMPNNEILQDPFAIILPMSMTVSGEASNLTSIINETK